MLVLNIPFITLTVYLFKWHFCLDFCAFMIILKVKKFFNDDERSI